MCFLKVKKIKKPTEFEATRVWKKGSEIIATEYIRTDIIRMPKAKTEHHKDHHRHHDYAHRHHHRRHSSPPLRIDFDVVEVESSRPSSESSRSENDIVDRRHRRYQSRRWWEEPESDDGQYHNWSGGNYLMAPEKMYVPEWRRREGPRRRYPSRRDDYYEGGSDLSIEVVSRSYRD
jgi:hypothetical protein